MSLPWLSTDATRVEQNRRDQFAREEEEEERNKRDRQERKEDDVKLREQGREAWTQGTYMFCWRTPVTDMARLRQALCDKAILRDGFGIAQVEAERHLSDFGRAGQKNAVLVDFTFSITEEDGSIRAKSHDFNLSFCEQPNGYQLRDDFSWRGDGLYMVIHYISTGISGAETARMIQYAYDKEES